jgi:hypothetical protein
MLKIQAQKQLAFASEMLSALLRRPTWRFLFSNPQVFQLSAIFLRGRRFLLN